MENTQIMEELRMIKKDLDYIKEHMLNIDTILTPEEEIELNESLRELEEGKTYSFDTIKKDRENA